MGKSEDKKGADRVYDLEGKAKPAATEDLQEGYSQMLDDLGKAILVLKKRITEAKDSTEKDAINALVEATEALISDITIRWDLLNNQQKTVEYNILSCVIDCLKEPKNDRSLEKLTRLVTTSEQTASNYKRNSLIIGFVIAAIAVASIVLATVIGPLALLGLVAAYGVLQAGVKYRVENQPGEKIGEFKNAFFKK